MTASKFLGGFLLMVAVMVITALVNGFTLATLWAWFIIPTFGLPALGIASAIGLAMVVSFLTYQYSSKKEESDGFVEDMLKALMMSLVRAAITLAVAFVVHLFM